MKIRSKVVDLIRNRSTSLPTLPVVINNIIATARNEKASAKDLADFIVKDQAISARVLKVANSAYYGMSRQIDSISRAIVVMGFREVMSLALGTGIISTLSQKGKGTLLDIAELWKHSIGVGFAARKIADKTRKSVEESTILVGLLHDMGKVILCVYFPNEYAEVLEKTTAEQASLCVIERELLGLDHAEMGFLITEQWKFPEQIVLPVRYHHHVSKCPEEHLYMAAMINVANFVCHQAGVGKSGDQKVEKSNEALAVLKLSDQDIVTLAEELQAEEDQVEDFLKALS